MPRQFVLPAIAPLTRHHHHLSTRNRHVVPKRVIFGVKPGLFWSFKRFVMFRLADTIAHKPTLR
jgi:hypothetical protein